MDRATVLAAVADALPRWSRELGFAAVGVTDLSLGDAPARLRAWLERGFHGQMQWMQAHEALRTEPARLLPGACRAICVRMDYRPGRDAPDWVEREQRRLADPTAAVVSIYARGRDYHKVLRARLRQLAGRIAEQAGPFGHRVCTDSAPVMEVLLGRNAALGWRGKHTLLLTREAGSMFFLGEILTDLPLPLAAMPSGADAPVPPAASPREDHCGSCTRCITACPTGAIVGPYQLDARRCISYLTIEHPGAIPVPLRPLIGNRIYGCDDCQLACPWNRHAQVATVADFDVRNGLDRATLVELFAWDEPTFRARHAGSAILRIGHVRWLRNLAVALGNAPRSPQIIAALRSRTDDPSPLVREHVAWALAAHEGRDPRASTSSLRAGSTVGGLGRGGGAI